jgi:Zn-dependent protease
MHFLSFSLRDMGCWYAVFLFSLVAHEAGHAFAAWRLGDATARAGGQVTLNPLPHMRREPIGTVVLPLLSFATQGWMIGWASVPLSRIWVEAFPRRSGLVAAAGPAVNLLLTGLSLLIIRFGLSGGWLHHPVGHAQGLQSLVVGASPGLLMWVGEVLSITFCLNAILFLFNLIPLPPLDGASILKLVIPTPLLPSYGRLLSSPQGALAGLVAAWILFPRILGPVFRRILALAAG